MSLAILYSFRRCPCAMRPRTAIITSGIQQENHLMRRMADLLHISHGDYIAAKMRAKPADLK